MTPPARTHYAVLGLARDATPGDIEANYRLKLAQLKLRKDLAPAEVVALRMAHQALADPAQRAAYDRTLSSPRRARETVALAVPLRSSEVSFWQSTPVTVVGILVLAGIAFAGWNHWQKKRAPPPQALSMPAAKKAPTKPGAAPVPAKASAAPGATKPAAGR